MAPPPLDVTMTRACFIVTLAKISSNVVTVVTVTVLLFVVLVAESNVETTVGVLVVMLNWSLSNATAWAPCAKHSNKHTAGIRS